VAIGAHFPYTTCVTAIGAIEQRRVEVPTHHSALGKPGRTHKITLSLHTDHLIAAYLSAVAAMGRVTLEIDTGTVAARMARRTFGRTRTVAAKMISRTWLALEAIPTRVASPESPHIDAGDLTEVANAGLALAFDTKG